MATDFKTENDSKMSSIELTIFDREKSKSIEFESIEEKEDDKKRKDMYIVINEEGKEDITNNNNDLIQLESAPKEEIVIEKENEQSNDDINIIELNQTEEEVSTSYDNVFIEQDKLEGQKEKDSVPELVVIDEQSTKVKFEKKRDEITPSAAAVETRQPSNRALQVNASSNNEESVVHIYEELSTNNKTPTTAPAVNIVNDKLPKEEKDLKSYNSPVTQTEQNVYIELEDTAVTPKTGKESHRQSSPPVTILPITPSLTTPSNQATSGRVKEQFVEVNLTDDQPLKDDDIPDYNKRPPTKRKRKVFIKKSRDESNDDDSSSSTNENSIPMSTKILAVLQAATLLLLVPLLGLTGTVLNQTSPDNNNMDNNTNMSDDSMTAIMMNMMIDDIAQNIVQQILTNQQRNSNETEFINLINQGSTALQDDLNQLVNASINATDRVEEINDTVMNQVSSIRDISKLVNRVTDANQNMTQELTEIIDTLSNLKNTSTSTAGVIDDILLIAERLTELHNQTQLINSNIPVSCRAIKIRRPNSPSGYYYINNRTIYCNMGQLCGSSAGWTRLGYLDMCDATMNCPPALQLFESGGVRACGRPTGGPSCPSVQFPSYGISYSQVCGRVTGYQKGTTDALLARSNDINAPYLDGVSITRGSPRQHVWSYMAGNSQMHSDGPECPCNTGSTVQVPSFIGNHYYCEAAFNGTGHARSTDFFPTDPLWDGQNCASLEATCCTVPGLPWFHRNYGNTTTTDYIELRVCSNEPIINEDIPISLYEIYVQ